MEKKAGNNRFELRLLFASLQKVVEVYESIKNGDIPALEQTKKATQNSIKEICAALSELVDL